MTRAAVDYRGNCGNISSAIGPFAIDEALLPAREPATVVRIHNTNTQKVIHAHVPVESGQAAVRGDFALDGVPGTGARIALDFLDPGGAVTGRLLPTGRAQDLLEVPGLGPVSASLVDATNPMVFVRAKDLGLDGTERPEDLDGRPGLPARLEAIRAAAAVRMGLARTPEEASRTSTAVPKIAIVAPPAAYRTLAGATVESDAVDLVARIVSMGKVHRAFALTGAMCLAVAARIPGTLPHEAGALAGAAGDVRIGHPSGVLPIASAIATGTRWRPGGADGHRVPHGAATHGRRRPRPLTLRDRGGHSWPRRDASSSGAPALPWPPAARSVTLAPPRPNRGRECPPIRSRSVSSPAAPA